MSIDRDELKKYRQELTYLVTAVSAFIAEIDTIFTQAQDKERGKKIGEALKKLEVMRDRALVYGLGLKKMLKVEDQKVLKAFKIDKPEEN